MKSEEFELLEQKPITYEELKQIQTWIKNLPKFENCKKEFTIECRKIAEIQWDEKTKFVYYVRLASHDYDEDYEFQIIKQTISI